MIINNKKVCVFVDGENFRHSIKDLFPSDFDERSYLPRSDWSRFFDWVVYEAMGDTAERVRTYWYVIQNIDFSPYNLNSKREDYVFLESKFSTDTEKAEILSKATTQEEKQRIIKEILEESLSIQHSIEKRFAGWSNIHDAIVNKHTAIEFRKAGSIRYDLLKRKLGSEKAVDVKLAIDLIRLKDIYDAAIIVSGDQDYVPAVDAIKDYGKYTVNVAFKTEQGRLLPGGARRLNQSTDRNIELEHTDLKRYLGF